MYADPKRVQMREQLPQLLCPACLFNDVLDKNIVARFGKGHDGPVKTVKEPGALIAQAGMRRFLFDGAKAAIGKLIRRVITEGFRQRLSERLGECRFAGTRGAVQ